MVFDAKGGYTRQCCGCTLVKKTDVHSTPPPLGNVVRDGLVFSNVSKMRGSCVGLVMTAQCNLKQLKKESCQTAGRWLEEDVWRMLNRMEKFLGSWTEEELASLQVGKSLQLLKIEQRLRQPQQFCFLAGMSLSAFPQPRLR